MRQVVAPPAMLVMASLTSVSFELVKSDPWETTMRAAVDGLSGSFMSKGGEVGKEVMNESGLSLRVDV